MPEFIPLSEVLHAIDSGRPFDMEAVTCNVAKGTGGAIRSYPQHVKFIAQRLTQKESARAATLRSDSKDPNHNYHSTRNIYNPVSHEIIKVHIRLITRFNGKPVS